MSWELSRYRLRAREIITEVLANLPQDATKKDASKALRAARPSNLPSWVYKCWLREQRDALRLRFPPPPMTTAPTIAYRLQQMPWQGRMLAWLRVACGWCEGDIHHTGCLLCASHWHRLREVIANPTFLALREAAACPMTETPNPDLVGVLCDWLEDEAGITVER